MSEFETVIDYEPLTKEMLTALWNILPPHGAIVLGVGDVDIGRGRGIITPDKTKACVWTKDGRRLTVSISPYGIFSSLSKEPDPDAPEAKEEV